MYDLKPIKIREGDDETECLTIQITVGECNIVVLNGYGPQLNDCIERKNKFWEYLEDEVDRAENLEMPIIIQLDSNAHLGNSVVLNDPNQEPNHNGLLMRQFLERTNLTVVNSLDICKGVITRSRKTIVGTEKSVLDFFLVCRRMRPYLTKMIVDEKGDNKIVRFDKRKIIESDHNSLKLECELKYKPMKPERIEIFNFKDEECQQAFHKEFNKSTKLTKTFETDKPFLEQFHKFRSKLQSAFHKSFRKIRVTKTKPRKETKGTWLQRKRKNLKLKIRLKENESCQEIKKEVDKIEEQLGREAENNLRDVKEICKRFSGSMGSMNVLGVWKSFKKLNPKITPSLPVAKLNSSGHLVTNSCEIKELLLNTFMFRMRQRPIRPDLAKLQELRERLLHTRINSCKKHTSPPWKHHELISVLKSLKKKACRDPHGWINELFDPEKCGKDIVKALLVFFNKVKHENTIPQFLQFTNISCIYKGKGSKMDPENDRGIFIVTTLRTILMKLIYNTKYKIIDDSMSSSQVGARKGQNIRNHIWVLNSIMHDVLSSSKNNPVDLQVLDFKQCFDALWLEECLNDLYEGGLEDNMLSLLYEAGRNVKLAVKTPNGISHRKNIDKVVMQGDVFGSLMCSKTVDTFGKECLEGKKHLYLYKKIN